MCNKMVFTKCTPSANLTVGEFELNCYANTHSQCLVSTNITRDFSVFYEQESDDCAKGLVYVTAGHVQSVQLSNDIFPKLHIKLRKPVKKQHTSSSGPKMPNCNFLTSFSGAFESEVMAAILQNFGVDTFCKINWRTVSAALYTGH